MPITKDYGQTVTAILDLLSELGPMTGAELREQLDLTRNEVSSIIARMAKPTKRKPQRVYVTHYVYDMEGQRRYPRAVYALGSNPNAKRPGSKTKENRKRSDAKRRALLTTNFVFNLGLKRREFESARSTHASRSPTINQPTEETA